MKIGKAIAKLFVLMLTLAIVVSTAASCGSFGDLLGSAEDELADEELLERNEALLDEYEVAVENGYSGSFNDWFSSLIENGGGHVYGDFNISMIAPDTYVMTAVCIDCGETIENEVHIHLYHNTWSYDDTHHWFSSACGHDDLGAYGEHTLDGDGACSVCGFGKKIASEGLDFALREGLSEYAVCGIGTCRDSEIIVPEEHDGYPVTEIAEFAFNGLSSIISVTLPESIVKIGDKAFAGCEALVEVNMPENIDIGLDVFRDSINVEIKLAHNLYYVSATKATCDTPGNIEHYLCSDCGNAYADEDAEERIYDVTVSAEHKFSNGYCKNCNTPSSAVNIVWVDDVGNLGKFALGTLENAIGLPTAVRVQTADGEYHDLEVKWDLSGYVKNRVGKYIINGHILSAGYVFDEGNGVSAKISTGIEIVDYMEGTADIVFVIDTTGSMSSYINSVKNNIISLAEEIDRNGVSARWALVDYRDITCDGRYSTHVVKNGSSDWYSSVEEYKNAIASLGVDGGGDAPECAVDGLMMASELNTRKDTRTFFILVTDIGYKVDNNYGVSSMSEMANILVEKNIYTSVVCPTSNYSDYSILTDSTDGILVNIYSNFAATLHESLVKIIQEKVEA